jgi:hypothetical protein
LKVEEDLGETRHEQLRSHKRHRPGRRFQPAAFAIATSFIASSFAGEFTVHQGKRYRATLSLSSVERLADNAAIAQRFRALGFTGVRVSGSGATRKVEGVWPGKDMSANMPRQIVAVARL